MDAWVIWPGHGSEWLTDCHWEGDYIIGQAWDDSGSGSALMPDDYRGEGVTLNVPRSYVLRTVEQP